ncbi:MULTISPECIES: TetR/AcrR family transcriptional regulator C-terminal domain-containing protein [Stenotrophomonas]|uniref:TetR/AcrR family transcriptional regulator C-terminal domain-containing protein n=1 Tax=Stenotrophomonas bentonitica TaxID=1450134 RepID=A0ABU9JKH6_9GAMM|nr:MULTISPECIES: TetR/AcrR family transcriptional regulator C-terminal domain-containing protein [Stenotrophomonas]MDX5514812.1 TetR/AcrR family transcriptional regulator C-terminal domain-containing protein [Stenotrophomonas sp. RG-453]OFS91735.1 TetR family transcriptional regulator [Stenotrophomonas sp. HMSC10F06]
MRQPIAREDIVKAAFRILDEAGPEGITLRKVACSLGIRAPSLYWHFKSKQALIDAMADAMICDVARVIPDGQPWRQTLLQIGREFRRAFKARRDGARVYAGTFLATENVLRVGEAGIAALMGAGAPARFAATAAMDLVYYTMGFVIEEQSWPGDGSMEALGEAFMALAEARFPHCWQARDAWSEVDFDARFEQGLGLMLDGIERRLSRES